MAATADEPFYGNRIQRLRKAMVKTLDGCIDGVSLGDFLSCFPELVESHRGTLTELHLQMSQIMKLNVTAEFEKIVEELDLATKLDALDELCDQADQDEYREHLASQSPEEAMSLARIQIKQAEKDKLKELIQQQERECTEVQGRVDKQREQASAMETAILAASNVLEPASQAAEAWLGTNSAMNQNV